MHNCCLTAQQLAATVDVDDYDNQLDSVGAIFYEIAPGAPFLSQQQIANVMRAASKYLRKGRSSDLTISVQQNGVVSFKVDLPGACK